MTEKTIYIVRHGQTDMNLQNELQGRRDVPMNAEGRRQAGVIRDFFVSQGIKFDRVYSSPLGRAVETAQIVTGGELPIIIDARLTEMDYGPYEGADLAHPPQEIITFFRDFVHNPAPEGMEPLMHVVKRAGDFMEDLVKANGRTVLISTHAIAMKGILEYLTPESHGAFWSKYIGNCSVYRTIYDGKAYRKPEEVFAG